MSQPRMSQPTKQPHRPKDHRWDNLLSLGAGLLVLLFTICFWYVLGYLVLQPQTLLALPYHPLWGHVKWPVTVLLVLAFTLGALCVWLWQGLQTRRAELKALYSQRLMESSKVDIDRQAEVLQAMEAKIASLELALNKALSSSS